METFNSYEQEFCKQTQQVSRKLQVLNSQPRERKEAAINEAQLELGEAEKCLRQMEIELSSMGAQQRIALQRQFKSHRDDFEQLKKDFRKEEAIYMEQKNKDTLMGSRLDVASTIDHKQRLLATNDLAYNQNQKLQNAKQQALECEQIAVDVENDLRVQKDTILHAQKGNQIIIDNLGTGNRLIGEMTRKALTNRIVLLCFGLIITIVIGCLIYIKFSQHLIQLGDLVQSFNIFSILYLPSHFSNLQDLFLFQSQRSPFLFQF